MQKKYIDNEYAKRREFTSGYNFLTAEKSEDFIDLVIEASGDIEVALYDGSAIICDTIYDFISEIRERIGIDPIASTFNTAIYMVADDNEELGNCLTFTVISVR